MVNRVEEFWSDLQARSAPTSSSKSAEAILRVLNDQTITTASNKRRTMTISSGAAEAENTGHRQPVLCLCAAASTNVVEPDLKTRCRPLIQRLVDVSLSVRLSALTDLQVCRSLACVV